MLRRTNSISTWPDQPDHLWSSSGWQSDRIASDRVHSRGRNKISTGSASPRGKKTHQKKITILICKVKHSQLLQNAIAVKTNLSFSFASLRERKGAFWTITLHHLHVSLLRIDNPSAFPLPPLLCIVWIQAKCGQITMQGECSPHKDWEQMQQSDFFYIPDADSSLTAGVNWVRKTVKVGDFQFLWSFLAKFIVTITTESLLRVCFSPSGFHAAVGLCCLTRRKCTK